MKLYKIISVLAFASVFAMICSSVTDINPFILGIPAALAGLAHGYGFINLPAGILMVNFGLIDTVNFPTIDGREAMGGYTSIAYLALLTDIETFPSEPDIETVTTAADLVKLIDSFVMKSNKYFYEVRVKPRSTQFTPEGQGEVGGRSFKAKGSFFIPGMDDESMGLARLLNNKYGVLIIPDPDGKHRICIGTEALPCEFAPTGASGAAPADAKGFTFNYECDSFAPGWIYNGSIAISGSVVPAIS